MATVRSRPRTGRRVTVVAAALLAGAGLAACRPAPSSLTVTTVIGSIDRPWDLAFTPGGGILFTEKSGRIRFRVAATHELRTLAEPADSVVASEGGMMGVAIDPAFGSNRRVYACFLSDKGTGLDVRLVRFRINDAVTALVDRVDIVTGIPVNTTGEAGRHSGCRPRFGPDGRLWVGTGDAATAANPQSPTSLGGKVLRIDTNGNGVAGNAKPPFDPRIYTYGHRNVQGIAFSPGGTPYSIEHGTYRDDEVNRLVAGANYGWDPRPAGGGSSYDESRPMTDTARHPSARAAVWSSGDPTIAPSGGTFLKGDKWSGWNKALAMAVLKDHHLRVLAFGSSGTSVEQQWVELDSRGRLRVAVQGPDGNLSVATDASPGVILKVTPTK
jgi:glucose/arabinose dehydrogenase